MKYGTTATCIKILSKSMNIAARKIYFMFVVLRGGGGGASVTIQIVHFIQNPVKNIEILSSK